MKSNTLLLACVLVTAMFAFFRPYTIFEYVMENLTNSTDNIPEHNLSVPDVEQEEL